ncbi:MAG: GDP-mannose 4,6-dehydratase [Candidatus Sumerlaeaceae bacterium]|nr:GDP-mannose 4,6-dehydratase [Candidatus Sumerlaeaceae bacterium]
MRCLVTGVAGFIGSSLAQSLLERGDEVIGVDCFIPYYARELKEWNLAQLRCYERFRFIEKEVGELFANSQRAADELLDGVDVVFHQAAQAGVRASWGSYFETYCLCNILATQKLLEACKLKEGIRVVYASSSSVYGETMKFPMSEDDLPRPVSPYGVTKLAAEHLVRLYTHNYGVPTVSLRYFTVYGPRQRPDMAFHRLLKAVLTDQPFTLFGSGEQTRDFTYISDIVAANISAAETGVAGGVYNIGGGSRVSMNEVIEVVADITGRRPRVIRTQREKGDVTHTGADVSRAKQDLGFIPKVRIKEGLAAEAQYIKEVVLPLGV